MTIRIGSRLSDPHNTVDGATLRKLDEKLSSCMTRMFRLPENGGNPFLFALSAPKPHELAPPEFFGIEKGMTYPDGSPMRGTAATDGRKYYWDPDFLMELLDDDVPTVMAHESFHVLFFHCMRLRAAKARIANWAFDYVVNGTIQHNHETTRRKGELWGNSLGKPILFKDLLEHIDGVADHFPEPKGKPEPRVFVDMEIHGRSPESIYAEIMKHWDSSPRKCPKCGALSMDPKTRKPKGKGPCKNRPKCEHGGLCCPVCGSPVSIGGSGYGDGMPVPMDAHIDSSLSKQEVQADTMRAAQHTKTMRGSVPSEVEEMLGELIQPQLKFTDIVRSACMRKAQESGMENDWKRFRRRWIHGSKRHMRQYLPKRHSHRPRWLAMIDTSGSMSQDDLVYGLSQLQVLSSGTEGFIVPCDATIHWQGLTKVESASDIQKTKLVGRGGTVFDDFFREFPEKVGVDFDCVVIITDGDCGTVPMELRPPLDVVWVLTREHKEYKPSFGRVAPLRVERP